MMKTLAQIEPRTSVSSLPFTISQSGSYYMTTNLTGGFGDGITIGSSDVTLDLNGFALAGGSGHGVFVSGVRSNITIRNGTVRGWGAAGLNASLARASRFEGLQLSHNAAEGLYAGIGCLVTQCVASTNGTGIRCGGFTSVKDCVTRVNVALGILASGGGSISNCDVDSNGGIGIFISAGAITLTSCTVRNNTGTGIEAGDDSMVKDCLVTGNRADGIVIESGCHVSGCTVSGNTVAGIHATEDGNRIEANHCLRNAIGLDLAATGNYVANNTVRSNTDNYNIAQSNQLNLLLSEIPETIDWTATVLLAGTLTGKIGSNGIVIAANDVTVDLGGHALVPAAGASNGYGIFAMRGTNIVVRNGTVRGWPGNGVDLFNTKNALVEDIRASHNGITGITVGEGSMIRNCSVFSNSTGISCADAGAVERCIGSRNAEFGIRTGEACTVSDCTAYANRIGISTENNSRVSNCNVCNNVSGISCRDGCHITGCTVSRNRYGIQVADHCLVTGNACHSNGLGTQDGTGIFADHNNHIDGNAVTFNARGIYLLGGGNLITRNRAKDNSPNYSEAPQAINGFGPFMTLDATGKVDGNAWANSNGL
jgi:parallel beta-helix repeat protein